jgi:hypothetical protein
MAAYKEEDGWFASALFHTLDLSLGFLVTSSPPPEPGNFNLCFILPGSARQGALPQDA